MMETENITVTNVLFDNDESAITRALLKLNGVLEVLINPEQNVIAVTYEHIDREKIINRLYALGYYENKSNDSIRFHMRSSPILLPQKWH